MIADLPTFCLTLPEKPERTANARQHFADMGVGDVTFIDAINADTFGLLTKFPYEVDNPGSGFNIGPHCVGIWLSHWMTWLACSMRPESHFFILEDDAKFDPDWQSRMGKALQDVPPDFDWLFIGSCCASAKKRRHIQGEVYDVRYPCCFQAYVLAKKAIPHLLRTQRKVYAPIDISVIFHSFAELKVYTLYPMAVRQFNTEIME